MQRQRTKGAKGWESWGWGTVPINTLLKLLVKTSHFTASIFTAEKYVKEGKRNFWEERNEVTADETAGSWKLWGERLKITADKDQPARKLAVETRGEITLQQRSTNQREWLAVETPDERECVHILLLPTYVTFHRSLRLAPCMMLCIYTSW